MSEGAGPAQIVDWEERAALRILNARDYVERRRVYAEVYAEDNAFWLARHGPTGISGDTARNRPLLRSLPTAGGPVLDIGGGAGVAGAGFPSECAYVVVDPASTPPSMPGLGRFRVSGYGTELPFRAASFGLVVALDVLEHLHPEDAERCVSEARRVLRPGGHLLLATPHRFTGPWDSRCNIPDGRKRVGLHVNEMSLRDMIRLVRPRGFRPVAFQTRRSRPALRWGPAVAVRAGLWEVLGGLCPRRIRPRGWSLAILLALAA